MIARSPAYSGARQNIFRQNEIGMVPISEEEVTQEDGKRRAYCEVRRAMNTRAACDSSGVRH